MKHWFDKCRSFDTHKHIRCVGIVSILIFMVTQSMESAGIFPVCVYCQTIRASIGLIGLIMVLPICPIFSRLFTIVIAYMGAHVAAAGIFMNIQRATYFTEFTVLATIALIILAGQVMIMISYKAK
jgi:hypothetical protein